MAGTSKPLFRHRGVSLLRAAAVTADDIPTQWPDLTDAESCRAWLQDVWTRFGLVEAIHLASSDLAARVEVICVDGCSVDRSVRRATIDRKSTRLNSSHVRISYAVFCLKKKKKK